MDTEFTFGHGFVPRIDRRNYKGVDRAVGMPGQMTLDGTPLDLPWAIVDAELAGSGPALLDHLRDHGTRLMVDTQAWRYREASAFGIEKFRSAASAPEAPVETPADVATLTRDSLLAQAKAGADAYLVPGFLPRHRADDVRPLTLAALEAATDFADIPPRPLVAFIGVHSENPDAALDTLEDISRGVAGLYVQVSPLDPRRDSTAKLSRIAEFFVECERDFTVIAGRAGAMTIPLRALGISAVDAGLGEGETFNFRNKVRVQPVRQRRSRNGGRGARLYVAPLDRSMYGREWEGLTSIDAIRGLLRCPEVCCRFHPINMTVVRGVEHSLRWRIREATETSALEGRAVRLERARRMLTAKHTAITTCSTALVELGQQRLSLKHVEHQLGVLTRVRGHGQAA